MDAYIDLGGLHSHHETFIGREEYQKETHTRVQQGASDQYIKGAKSKKMSSCPDSNRGHGKILTSLSKSQMLTSTPQERGFATAVESLTL